MITLAYDASLNNEWVARYALHLAARAGRTLRVLHVRDREKSDDELQSACERLTYDASLLQVAVRFDIRDAEKSVGATLLQSAGEGLVVCGTRLHRGGRQRRQLLRGSVADLLLARHSGPVLALRVVQPGLLGAPRHLLVPFTDLQAEFVVLAPILSLFLPDLEELDLLCGVRSSPFRLRHHSEDEIAALQRRGLAGLAAARQSLANHCRHLPPRIEERMAIVSDWTQEMILTASRLRSRLILLAVRRERSRSLFADPLEKLLRTPPCDIALYRAL